MTDRAIDLSSAQHRAPIDYAKAAARTDAVIVKLTEGGGSQSYVNPYAAQDLVGFRAQHLPVAGYHFLHPSLDIASQLALVMAHRDAVSFVWVDSELTGVPWPQVTERTHAMIVALFGAGLKAGLYSNPSFLSEMPGSPWGYDLWLADYGPARAPRPCTLWQHTDAASIPGIAGPVDESYYYGAEPLTSYFGPKVPVPKPTPKPAPAPTPKPTPPPTPSEEMPVQFMAKSFDGPATLLYQLDVRGNVCRGVSATEAAQLVKVGVKDYGSTLDQTWLKSFVRVG